MIVSGAWQRLELLQDEAHNYLWKGNVTTVTIMTIQHHFSAELFGTFHNRKFVNPKVATAHLQMENVFNKPNSNIDIRFSNSDDLTQKKTAKKKILHDK